jgi:hypothetical protein
MYDRLPGDEPSGSKHVEYVINKNINLEKKATVGLYSIKWYSFSTACF